MQLARTLGLLFAVLYALGSNSAAATLMSWTSADGETWMPLLTAPVVLPALPAQILAGVCVAKRNATGSAPSAFTPILARASRLSLETLENRVTFRRSDVTADGKLDISDPVALLGFLFLGTSAPACEDAADTDDNGQLELTDAIYTLAYLFLGGPAPPPPFSGCDLDPSHDTLGCAAEEACL